MGKAMDRQKARTGYLQQADGGAEEWRSTCLPTLHEDAPSHVWWNCDKAHSKIDQAKNKFQSKLGAWSQGGNYPASPYLWYKIHWHAVCLEGATQHHQQSCQRSMWSHSGGVPWWADDLPHHWRRMASNSWWLAAKVELPSHNWCHWRQACGLQSSTQHRIRILQLQGFFQHHTVWHGQFRLQVPLGWRIRKWCCIRCPNLQPQWLEAWSRKRHHHGLATSRSLAKWHTRCSLLHCGWWCVLPENIPDEAIQRKKPDKGRANLQLQIVKGKKSGGKCLWYNGK